ncbi:MAG: hypothetical protein AB7O66_16965 [Limisphaerales bacterium]
MTRRHFAGIATLGLAILLQHAPTFEARAADAPKPFQVSSLHFTQPPSWESVPTQSSMRKAVLKVPNKAGDPGEVIFFHFGPGGAGGTQANVDRWFRQFREPKDQIKARTEESKVGNIKLTYVSAEGTYMSGMPGGPQTPKPGYGLLGAIIEDPAGSIFIRFTGPKDLLATSTAEFKKMVETAK